MSGPKITVQDVCGHVVQVMERPFRFILCTASFTENYNRVQSNLTVAIICCGPDLDVQISKVNGNDSTTLGHTVDYTTTEHTAILH